MRNIVEACGISWVRIVGRSGRNPVIAVEDFIGLLPDYSPGVP